MSTKRVLRACPGHPTLQTPFFTYSGEPENGDWGKDSALTVRVRFIRSFDGGKTWEKKSHQLQTLFAYDETDGPLVRLKDGSVLIAVNGRAHSGPPDQAAVLRSTNRGRSWKLLATIKAAHDLQEITVAELPDGQLVMMARPESDICWSHDHGHTWTQPVTFGFRLFAPSLYVEHQKPKRLYARELCHQAYRGLQADKRKPALADVEARTRPRRPERPAQIRALIEYLKDLPDYRARIGIYRLWTLVAYCPNATDQTLLHDAALPSENLRAGNCVTEQGSIQLKSVLDVHLGLAPGSA